MPLGHHIATCFCCGKQWTCGDCIPTVCHECESNGHTGGFECKKCNEESERRWHSIASKLSTKLHQSVLLLSKCYSAMSKRHWEDGPTEGEVMSEVSDFMDDMFGVNWGTKLNESLLSGEEE